MAANGTGTTSATMATSTLHGMNTLAPLPVKPEMTAGTSVVTSPSMPALSSAAGAAAPAPAPAATATATLTTSATPAAASADTKSKAGKESKSSSKAAAADGNGAAGATAEEKKKNKRCMFQKDVVKTLKHWLSQNFENPYPTEDEKKQLASHTGLTQLQVNNWFINARRRLVQPLVEKYNKDHPGATPLPSVQDAQKNRRRRQVNRDPSLTSPAKMGKFDGLSPGSHIAMPGMGSPQAMQSPHVPPGHGPMQVAQGGIAMQSPSQSMAAPMNAFNPQLLTMQPAIFAGQPPAGAMNVQQTAFWDPAHSYLQPTAMSFLPTAQGQAIDTTMGQMVPTHSWTPTPTSNYGSKMK
eukprot:scpid52492/ scgid11509/ Homeobox protein unc-62; Uncoordinated protein 62